MAADTTGPAQLAAVKGRLSITDSTEDDDLELIVGAVNEYVRALPIAVPLVIADPGPEVEAIEWPDRVVLAATMLAVRWYTRRNTPTGDLTGDFGIAYVRRTDPDIAQLLQLGTYAPPVFG